MKLLRQLTEGLTMRQEEGGRKVIDYHDNNSKDDAFFNQTIKKKSGKDGVAMTSSQPSSGTQSKNKNDINLMKDDISTDEIANLESHNKSKPGAYQVSMKKYTAMPSKDFQTFMDALKQRDEENITMADGALERLSIRGAKSTASKLSKDMTGFNRFTHIFVVPLPSSHHLSKLFATHVAEEIRNRHKDVQVIENLLSKSMSPKIGSHLRGGKDKDAVEHEGRMFKDRPSKYQKTSSALRRKYSSPEDLEHHLNTHMDAINHNITKLKSGPQTKYTKIHVAELEKERIHFKTQEDKISNNLIEPTNSKREPAKIGSVFGLDKRLMYDRFTPDEEQMPERNGHTLIVLVDDNTDSDNSMIDAYRVLYKKGMVHKDTSTVVAVALHRLGVIK